MQDPIAAAVLQELQRRNMTITQLADLSEVDRTTLSKWLAGERSIRLESALRVMQVLRIRLISAEDHDDRFRTRTNRP